MKIVTTIITDMDLISNDYLKERDLIIHDEKKRAEFIEQLNHELSEYITDTLYLGKIPFTIHSEAT